MFRHLRYQGFIIFVCLFIGVLGELSNPYKILDLHGRATFQEIRQAYKQLAKEWHPDKSKHPNAKHRFVEIKQAYELLSDPERRTLYDNKGITEDEFYKKPDRFSFFTPNTFDDLFVQHGDHFNFRENDITFFYKLSVTTRQYDRVIIPKSKKIPHLLFFYTDWCFPCLQSAPYYRKIVDNLESLGINCVTVHSGREPKLTRRLNVHTLPSLVILLDGNVYVYKDTLTSIPKVIDFIRSKFPYKLVSKLKQENLEQFLNGWEDNKIRCLILHPRKIMRMRYLATAYYFRHRVAFGLADSDGIYEKYKIPKDVDTVLLFNENTSHPMASITIKDTRTYALHNIIQSNQYLALPRLSSQKILEALCPCEWNKLRRKLCVVLVTQDSSRHNSHRQSFRAYAQRFPNTAEKVQFAYMYYQEQAHFVNALVPGDSIIGPLLGIVIFWRKDTTHLNYDWLPIKWETNYLNNTSSKLSEAISRFLTSAKALAYKATVTDLFDEHEVSFLKKTLQAVSQFCETLYDNLGKDQIISAVSMLSTTLFILSIGYLMAHLLKKEERNIQKQKANKNSGNDINNFSSLYQPELRLYELRSEKYNGLIRLLKPGFRTILLIIDMQCRQQLIPPFHKAIWPYRRNKTLNFAYLYIERGVAWYKELLQMSLFEERELRINPRNCVGTVLALNGHRKYFCVFHAKLTESINQSFANPNNPIDTDCESGSFIGFHLEDSQSDSEEILLKHNLLDGLSSWLDRLFDGSTQRYHINYWPEFPIK